MIVIIQFLTSAGPLFLVWKLLQNKWLLVLLSLLYGAFLVFTGVSEKSDQIKNLNRQITELQQTINERDRALENLKFNLKQKYNNLENNKNNLKNQNIELTLSLTTSRKEIDRLKGQIIDLNNTIKANNKEILRLKLIE